MREQGAKGSLGLGDAGREVVHAGEVRRRGSASNRRGEVVVCGIVGGVQASHSRHACTPHAEQHMDTILSLLQHGDWGVGLERKMHLNH